MYLHEAWLLGMALMVLLAWLTPFAAGLWLLARSGGGGCRCHDIDALSRSLGAPMHLHQR